MNDFKNNENSFFQKYKPLEVTDSFRILCTPSSDAKNILFYVQEVGTLKSLKPHTSQRENLDSYLFMVVLSGAGFITYNGKKNDLRTNDVIFIVSAK